MLNRKTNGARDFAIVIMAAGKGTRLKSKRAKVLHEIGGQPLLAHVIKAAQQIVPPNRFMSSSAIRRKTCAPLSSLWV
jgi:bifunctional N-acetylglucosamine-1-phosphate-uridyltransferase/glucosamine-1-phosphate-acetyltransferase GlmU-like protein